MRQALAQDVEQAVHHFATIAARRLDRACEDPIAHLVEMLERQVLQLEVKRIQAEAIRNRRVDVERLARNAATMRVRHRIERAHVVQTVGELDQDDAHIARHRQQHLSKALGLGFLARRELDLIELRDAVDHFSDGAAERRFQLRACDGSVLHHVV